MAIIPLKGRLHVSEALVSEEDVDLLSAHRWYVNLKEHTTYAMTAMKIPADQWDGKGRRWTSVSMHRMVMGFPEGMVIDHINGNGLDNRRENLRVATRSQNLINSRNRKKFGAEGYRGVNGGKFSAVGTLDGKSIRIGSFDTAEEAARAYDEWAIKNHGEFAILNLPRATSA